MMRVVFIIVFAYIAYYLLSVFIYYANKIKLPIFCRWVIESLRYPITRMIVVNRYKYMTPDQRLQRWAVFETKDHWSKGFWFSRSLQDVLLKKISKWNNLT